MGHSVDCWPYRLSDCRYRPDGIMTKYCDKTHKYKQENLANAR